MNILSATVVLQSGHPDKVSLTTDLPSPYLCDAGKDVPLFLNFDCGRGNGSEYVRKNFNLKAKVIKVS